MAAVDLSSHSKPKHLSPPISTVFSGDLPAPISSMRCHHLPHGRRAHSSIPCRALPHFFILSGELPSYIRSSSSQPEAPPPSSLLPPASPLPPPNHLDSHLLPQSMKTEPRPQTCTAALVQWHLNLSPPPIASSTFSNHCSSSSPQPTAPHQTSSSIFIAELKNSNSHQHIHSNPAQPLDLSLILQLRQTDVPFQHIRSSSTPQTCSAPLTSSSSPPFRATTAAGPLPPSEI